MRKENKKFYLVLVILMLAPLILIPTSTALTNIWGASVGEVKSYSYKTIYTGSIDGVTDNGDYTFTVVNIWDNDANNYTELLYARERINLGSPTMDLIVRQDQAGNWDDTDLRQPLGADIFPLVPIGYSSVDSIGMNWTAEIETINGLTNWTTTIEGNILVIHHWTTGTHGGTGAFYTQDDWIRWDITTGWLESYESTRDYGTPLNYVTTTTIEGVGWVADMTLIIGIIAVCIGGAAIAVTYLIWRKSKQR